MYKLQPTPVTKQFADQWYEWLSKLRDKLVRQEPLQNAGYTVAEANQLDHVAGDQVYISNETGGAVLAFSDGTDWRRVTDRSVIAA